MPISGFVISIDPETRNEAEQSLSGIEHLEIHGSDEKGNIVAVIDTQTSRDMQNIVDKLNALDFVLSVGMTYMNVEDVVDDEIDNSVRQVFEDARD